MKKIAVGLNWSLVAIFLILFILYASCNSGPTSIGQYGGASPEAPKTSASTAPPASSEVSPEVPTSNKNTTSDIPAEMADGSGAVVSTPNNKVCENGSTDCATLNSTTHGVPAPAVPATSCYLDKSCRGQDDIRNPQYPIEAIPSQDNKQNVINRQRRLIKEYQSYIKNIRGNCCGRVYSGGNLMTNVLSNKHWTPKPMISTISGNENALYLMNDDFSNIMSINPKDAEKYKVSFYDQDNLPSPPRTYALQASENWPMYQKTFDRSFVGRIPDSPNMLPFKVTPWSDWPGSGNSCPASKSCQGEFSPPWSVNKAFSCNGVNFDQARAPEPESMGGPPPYLAGQAPPP